ncbi:MAG: SH3 domain-containing protein, partial [Arenicella sp.]|nr:SH3 domain-containing protein [Arenicella sp.]
LYTNPKVRSVLITLVDERSSLKVVQRGETWSAVTSSEGFPVWVHGDYVNAVDEIGTITGSAVNARSVPIITNGTVVGRLEKNEIVEIIDKRKEWYRVIAPPRFKAWVKTEDFERSPIIDTTATEAVVSAPVQKQLPAGVDSRVEKLSGPRPINDNEWLYSQPADSYTLQLASFDDPVKIKEFVTRSKFIDNAQLHRFTSSSNDIEWTYFLYGAYADKPTAESVRLEINQRKAWIRTFGLLQQNRCISWKKQLPSPPELNKYCGS